MQPRRTGPATQKVLATRAALALLGTQALHGVACAELPPSASTPTAAKRSAAADPSVGRASAAAAMPMEATRLGTGVRRIVINKPSAYWQARGFRRLAPTIRPSLPARQHDVAVFLRLPASGFIRVARGEDGVLRLSLPPGSEADRVTRVPLRNAKGAFSGEYTVADVRGGRLDEAGREHFHVYRPAHGAPHAPLVGYEWLRSDGAQRKVAHERTIEHVRTTPRASATAPPSANYLGHFTRLMNCEQCHQPNKAAEVDPHSNLPLWPTDAQGWYVPLAVMRAGGELSTTADFHDPNAGDPFVQARCGEADAASRARGKVRWYECAEGSMPYGVRDVAAALAKGDMYSIQVCFSRRWLFSRMDAAAQAAFAEAMAPCATLR